jgi:hypothetical protein
MNALRRSMQEVKGLWVNTISQAMM